MLPDRKIFGASARGLDNRIVYKNRKVFAKYQLKRKSYYHTNLHQISKSLLQLFIFLLWLKMAGLSLLVVASLLDICNKTNLMLDIFKVHEKFLDYLQSSSTLPCKTRPDLICGRYDPFESVWGQKSGLYGHSVEKIAFSAPKGSFLGNWGQKTTC